MKGIKVISSKYLPEKELQFYRKPRSKKKRIIKKWRKDKRNWREVNVAYFFNGNIYGHNNMAKLINFSLH